MADSERQEQVVAMTLAVLLEELKRVDAKTYDDISHLELIGWKQPRNQAMDHLQGCIQRACERRGWRMHLDYYQCYRPGHEHDNETHEYSPESEIIYNSIVQSCIQRACERREWHWTIMKDPYQAGYRAEISVVSESHISDRVFIEDIAAECGDTPAEALLVAYIAAVKEEAKR